MTQEEMIEDILSSPVRLRESYIKNNYPDFHQKIIRYNKYYSLPQDISFKEKLWYFINNITEKVNCKICKGDVSFNRNFRNGYKNYCSSKCAQKNQATKEKRKNTIKEKYGVDNIAKLGKTKEKIAKTNLERYGATSSFQNEDVKKKWNKRIKEKYGVDHVFQSQEVKKKIKKTNLEKYGVNYFVQSDEYKSMLIELGHSKKMKMIYNDKTMKTNTKKYGVPHYTQSKDYKELVSSQQYLENISKKYFEKRKGKFNNNYKNYELISAVGYKDMVVKSSKCGHEFNILYDTFVNRYQNGHNCCTKCLPTYTISESSFEKEMSKFLDESKVAYIKNYRGIGIELDFYLPDYDVAIETNGLWWHTTKYKEKNFHLNKTQICNENNIDLIHIWEDDWNYKNKIIKSIILNRLGLINEKVFARKCKIKQISNVPLVRKFLNENHIQGFTNSKIKLGLYHNKELVSLMLFKVNINNKFELCRFASKKDKIVIGAASKLFKFFLENFNYNYNYNKIYTYSDISLFNGELYKKLGFEHSHRNKPNYKWVVEGIRENKMKYSKKKLKTKLKERDFMEQKGYYQIYDCGLDVWVYST